MTFSRQKLLVGFGVLLVAGALGVGGYFLGQASGEDLDAARAEGSEQGEREGAAAGAEEGFVEGRREARDEAFEESYEESYRKAYIEAYEEAGLDPPEAKDIKVPRPDRSGDGASEP